MFNHGFDTEREYQVRSKWDRFVEKNSRRISVGDIELADRDDLADVVEKLIRIVGRDAVVALSPDYAHGDRLEQLISSTVSHAYDLLKDGDDAEVALAAFSGDQAVKIMSIHKSKGLEFDTVVVLGVEEETFWAEAEAERSAYFVGISRAERRLLLTVCERRERPEGAGFWNSARSEHEEFLGYAQPYL